MRTFFGTGRFMCEPVSERENVHAWMKCGLWVLHYAHDLCLIWPGIIKRFSLESAYKC